MVGDGKSGGPFAAAPSTGTTGPDLTDEDRQRLRQELRRCRSTIGELLARRRAALEDLTRLAAELGHAAAPDLDWPRPALRPPVAPGPLTADQQAAALPPATPSHGPHPPSRWDDERRAGALIGGPQRFVIRPGTHPVCGPWITYLPAPGAVTIQADPANAALDGRLTITTGELGKYVRLSCPLPCELVTAGPLVVTFRLDVTLLAPGDDHGVQWVALLDEGRYLSTPYSLVGSARQSKVRLLWSPERYHQPLERVKAPTITFELASHGRVTLDQLAIGPRGTAAKRRARAARPPSKAASPTTGASAARVSPSPARAPSPRGTAARDGSVAPRGKVPPPSPAAPTFPADPATRWAATRDALAFFARRNDGWIEEGRADRPLAAKADGDDLHVLIGTLCAGERELEQCEAAIEAQSHLRLEHRIIAGLGEKEATATLMDQFEQSAADVLIKVDADTVLLDRDYVRRVCRVFAHNDRLLMLQMALLDTFSGAAMQGINAYRRGIPFRLDRQDPLFTDRIPGVALRQRLVDWVSFVDSAIHCPNPSPFQAFHFGVHRGVKLVQPDREHFAEEAAQEQLTYLERTWNHFLVRRERRLGLACYGFELALTEAFDVAQLAYADPHLRNRFRACKDWDSQRIEAEVRSLRKARALSERTETVRSRRQALVQRASAPVRRIVALLPHTLVFGGVNRFFEVGVALADLGVDYAVAVPEQDPWGNPVEVAARPDYPSVPVLPMSAALAQPWDVVLCGDMSGGVMVTMPAFDTRLAVIWILNGWSFRTRNLEQVAVARPDVVLANSTYVADQYAAIAPQVIAGAVDLETFQPDPALPPRDPAAFRIGCYPGRRKPVKRFDDAVQACRLLTSAGIPVELHVYDQVTFELDEPFPLVHHGALTKSGVRDLLVRLDAMVCPEDDAGWCNAAAEAMACGVPLVCTQSGTTDFAEHEVTALVVPRRAPKAIAEALQRLYLDPLLGLRLRTTGLERIVAFSWSAVARELLHVLRVARKDPDRRRQLAALALAEMTQPTPGPATTPPRGEATR